MQSPVQTPVLDTLQSLAPTGGQVKDDHREMLLKRWAIHGSISPVDLTYSLGVVLADQLHRIEQQQMNAPTKVAVVGGLTELLCDTILNTIVIQQQGMGIAATTNEGIWTQAVEIATLVADPKDTPMIGEALALIKDYLGTQFD
jgi:hypothetical protein